MAKQGLGRKVKDIAKAFTTPLPVGESWYEERLAICNTCDWNTKNMKEEDLSFSDKTKIAVGLCANKNHCTACGCCIERKASLKSSVCGLEEIDKAPKWTAIEATDSTKNEEVVIENISKNVGAVSIKDEGFIYDIGETSDTTKHIKFRLKRDKGFEVKDYASSCSCSVADFKQIDKNTAEFEITLSTQKFRKGVVTSRTFTVNYWVAPKKTKQVLINIKVKKND